MKLLALLLCCITLVGGCVRTSASGMQGSYNANCKLDPRLLDDLNNDCRNKILAQMPMDQLLKTFSPRDATLQELVRQRVAGFWPAWLLKKIETEGGERAKENLVLYYMALLRFPYYVNSAKGEKFLQGRVIGSTMNGPISAGRVGPHAVAYVLPDKNRIYVYETLTKKVVFSSPLPDAANHDNVRYEEFEQLGPSTFVQVMFRSPGDGDYRDDISVAIWDWSKPASQNPVLVRQNISKGLYRWGNFLQVIRISDDSFALLTPQKRCADKILIETWRWKQSVLSHSNEQKEIDLTQFPNGYYNWFQQLIDKARALGIVLDSSSLTLAPDAAGLQIEKNIWLRTRFYGTSTISYTNNKGKSKDIIDMPMSLLSFTENGDITFARAEKRPGSVDLKSLLINYNFFENIDAYARDLISTVEKGKDQ